MTADKFIVGRMYYQCHFLFVEGEPVVEVATWAYRGRVKKAHSSTSCDVPYYFYEFARASTVAPSDRDLLLIPSLLQATESMLTWEEFLIVAQEMPIGEFR